ncbi:hypothetical protein ACFY05_33015 [Microtetraspora fusca]|uniref:Uncharacterized protein n=1 Tax=Microtetraspora fusca TaxID=1997 RepID=A0ABW6VEW8_MICFU
MATKTTLYVPLHNGALLGARHGVRVFDTVEEATQGTYGAPASGAVFRTPEAAAEFVEYVTGWFIHENMQQGWTAEAQDADVWTYPARPPHYPTAITHARLESI